jgi:hypothetical protein
LPTKSVRVVVAVCLVGEESLTRTANLKAPGVEVIPVRYPALDMTMPGGSFPDVTVHSNGEVPPLVARAAAYGLFNEAAGNPVVVTSRATGAITIV